MNRKKKKQKQITMVVVLLFFLTGGIWYVISTGGLSKEQKNSTELTGVLELTKDVSETLAEETVSKVDASVSEETVVVYVCGAVNQPGIYTLNAGSRLHEAVTLAGGFSKEAAPAYHNLARSILDGERIYILSATEVDALTAQQYVNGEDGATNSSLGSVTLINLNTATAEQLTSLPGIGEAKAAAILEYRNKVGRFSDIEEIMNVSGIGEAMFEKIKDKIIVK